jgi:hypothetical protein
VADNSIRIVIETDAGRSNIVLDNLQKSLKKVGEQSKETKKSFIETARDVGLALDSWMNNLERVGRGMKAVYDVAKEGAELAKTRDSFARYTASVGVSMDQMLAKLRRASGGTIDELRLMQTASKAMSLGVTTDVTQMSQLLEVARNKGRLFGLDTTEAFEKITLGIGRMSPKILDDLGIRIPDAFKESTQAMSETEKISRLLELTIRDGQAEIERMGGVVTTTADHFDALEVAITNTKTAIGEGLMPILGPLAQKLSTVANAAAKAIRNLVEIQRTYSKLFDKNPLEALSYLSQYTPPGWLAWKAGEYGQDQGATADESLSVPGLSQFSDNYSKSFARYQSYRAKSRETFAKMGGDNVTPEEFARLKEEAQKLELFAKRAQKNMERFRQEGVDALADAWGDAKQAGLDFVGVFDVFGEKTTKITGVNTAARELYSEFDDMADLLESELKDAFDITSEGLNDLTNDLVADIEVLARWKATAEEIRDAAPSYLLGDTAGSFVTDLYDRTFNRSGPISQFFAGASRNYSPGAAADTIGGTVDSLFGWAWSEDTPSKTETEQRLRDSLQDPLARVVSDAFSEGIRGGDFGAALSGALRQSVTSAMSNMTSQIFSGVGGGGSAGGSGMGGISSFLFKPVRHSASAGGGLNWGNIAQNFAVGFAVNRIFGEGGIFGGRKENGKAETYSYLADVNSQVKAANEEREMLWRRGRGIETDTRQALKDAVVSYATAGYNDSGDGIFSKKTRTYNANTSATTATMQDFKVLKAVAEREMGTRAIEVMVAGLSDPIQSLIMSLDDLAEVIGPDAGITPSDPRWAGYAETMQPGQFEDRAEYLQMQDQIKKALTQERLTRAGDYFGMIMSNQHYRPNATQIGIAAGQINNMARGSSSFTMNDGTVMNGREYLHYQDIMAMAEATRSNYATMGQIESASPLEAARIQQESIDARVETLSEILGKLEAVFSDTTKSMEERTDAFEKWQQAYGEGYNLWSQGQSITSQASQAMMSNTGSWMSYAINNAYMRPLDAPTIVENYGGVGGVMRAAASSNMSDADKWGSILSGEGNPFSAEFVSDTYANSIANMRVQSQINLGLASGDPQRVAESLSKQLDVYGAQATQAEEFRTFYEGIMNDVSRTEEDREEAARMALEAEETILNSRLRQAEIEKQLEQLAEEKLSRYTADILGTMLTHLGEVQNQGGQNVIVLSAGQPDAKDLAQDLVDALGGENPELANVLTQFIEVVGRDRWG